MQVMCDNFFVYNAYNDKTVHSRTLRGDTDPSPSSSSALPTVRLGSTTVLFVSYRGAMLGAAA